MIVQIVNEHIIPAPSNPGRATADRLSQRDSWRGDFFASGGNLDEHLAKRRIAGRPGEVFC